MKTVASRNQPACEPEGNARCADSERIRRLVDAGRPTLGPPLSPDEVARFEEAHGIRLPEPYRTFCTVAGHGGEGPGQGLLALDEAAVIALEHPGPGALAASCAFDPARGIDDYPPDIDPARGALAVGDLAASWYVMLVVSGSNRGRLFVYDMNTLEGYWLEGDFLDWYGRWLATSR